MTTPMGLPVPLRAISPMPSAHAALATSPPHHFPAAALTTLPTDLPTDVRGLS